MKTTSDQQFAVTVEFDPDNGIWFIADSELPGLFAETSTLDELRLVIDDVSAELLQTNVPADQRGWSICIRHLIAP
ncbi:MAG: DUF1902 domain-containing protein [Beijerinckiaceae bacterium]